MECDGFEAQVLDLLYNELPAERRAEVEAHAASCEPCGALSRELAEARKAASVLTVREMPPPELDERIKLMARAAAPADVRRQSVRGGGLHVAAVVFLGLGLVASSFAVGVRYGKPGGISIPDVAPVPVPVRLPVPKDYGNTVTVSDTELTLDDRKRYQEELLALAKQKIESGKPREALTIYTGYVAGAKGRSVMLLYVHLGMAEAHAKLGEFAKAREAAERVKKLNAEWGINLEDIDRDAGDLLVEIDRLEQADKDDRKKPH